MGLKKYLEDRKYIGVKLKRIATNHFQIMASINGKKGKFILDTGASNSCVGLEAIKKFKLETIHSDHKAAGAGPEEIDTLISENNQIQIGKYGIEEVTLVLIDLTHINKALEKHEAKRVDGIIGADILEQGRAIIDYHKKKIYFKVVLSTKN